MDFALLALDGNAWDDIITALTAQISVAQISSVLVSAIGATIAIVFFWWAARKVTQVLFSGAKKGRINI